MTETHELVAAEAIRTAKARYFRGVDTDDGALVRSILHPDCVLDYRGCCTDPASGQDFMPRMNVVLRGRSSYSGGFAATGIVSVHHGHHAEISVTADSSAEAVWAMTDRLFMPAGAPFRCLTGYGWYHETYERVDGEWLIKNLRIQRIRVEVA